MHHGMPSGAAGSCHEALLCRNLCQKISGFFNGAHIRTDGHLCHPVKAQQLHAGSKSFGSGVLAELADKGGRHDGNHLTAFQNRADHLKYLSFIHDCAKQAANQTLSAGHASVLLNDGPAVLVAGDGIHSAGSLTGALKMNDGVVGTGLFTLAAADALVRVNPAFAVDKANGSFGANLLAGRGQTVLAVFRDAELIRWARMAGIRDDIDQRRLIILPGDSRMIHSLRHEAARLDGTD